MTDFILIVVIAGFFVGAALLVRALDRVIADSGPDTEAESGDEAPAPRAEASP